MTITVWSYWQGPKSNLWKMCQDSWKVHLDSKKYLIVVDIYINPVIKQKKNDTILCNFFNNIDCVCRAYYYM